VDDDNAVLSVEENSIMVILLTAFLEGDEFLLLGTFNIL